MTRIFTVLAWLAILLVAANLIIGLSLGDIRVEPSNEVRAWKQLHILFGIAAALAVVFVESVVVTYFIGTSRWCKEVVEAYSLDRSYIQSSNSIKRRTFPWALFSMLAIVGVIALGAAADPGTGRANTAAWAIPHLVGALSGLGFIAGAAIVEWNNIRANHTLIEQILAEVKRIRAERGLEV